MLAGIREILLISDPRNIGAYEKLLGNGSQLGLSLSYAVQDKPRGLADAFIVGEDFIAGDKVALILGDNVFYGMGFSPILKKASALEKGAQIFGYYVNNPSEFGVVEFNDAMTVLSLEEKPARPKTNYAVPGLYFYDETVVRRAKSLERSPRGEIEITDLNKTYLHEGSLRIQLLGRGFAWLDTGTCDGLADASDFVRTIQKRTGLYVSCLEEIAYLRGFITKEGLIQLGKEMEKTEYGQYILKIAEHARGG